MSPYRTEQTKDNSLKWVEKMTKSLTPAARVRREFRSGRPLKTPKAETPLHPSVVWQKSTAALLDLRGRMTAAKLNPADVRGFIVFVRLPDLDAPQFLALEGREGERMTAEEHRQEAFAQLSRENTLALGVILQQFDRETGHAATFPFQLMAVTDRGNAVLKEAAKLLQAVLALEPKN